jgi:hypothetical protein
MAMVMSELELEALPELEEEQLEMATESELHELHETEISPVRKWYADAMLEHMGFAAAEAETEDEAAEGFLPLIPMLAAKALPLVAKIGAKVLPKLASKILPRAARSFSRVVPRLTRGVSQITRGLFRNPRTRPLVRTVPTIARRTMGTLARQAASGRTITPQVANRVLATQARRLLRSPQQTSRVIRRARVLDRHLHRVSAGVAQPHVKLPAVMAQAAGRAGTCTCPTCGATPCRVPSNPMQVPQAAPAYCRCCGQILR